MEMPIEKPDINLVFGKYDIREVKVEDPSLANYINLEPRYNYHTHGRHSAKQFGKQKVNIIERLINAIMRSGSKGKVGGHFTRGRFGCGKKINATEIVKEAFDIIHKKTGKNPLQILVLAIENAAPREETTRVKYGGLTRHIAVDVAPQRRIDLALRNIGLAVISRSFRNKKSAAEVLADELIAAANNDPSSMAINKRIEIERVAKGAR